ncbi:hypothetical protein C8F01DRAFT_1244746 [Mycena amicta]|nr:hypothetical protein C8F01DRAFT_1244746 [Mycena amicta]
MASLKQRPRVEHVGSLLRPQPLLDQRTLLEQGKCTRDDLKAVEDAAVAHVVQLQRELGLETWTDGEMRRWVLLLRVHLPLLKLLREVYYEGVFDKLEGMTDQPHRPITEFKSYWPHVQILRAMNLTEFPSCFCSAKIKRTVPFYVDQFKALKQLVPPEDVGRLKVNMCPPTWFHQRHGSELTYDKSVYSTDDEYFNDLGIAYRAEIKELYELGCRNIQLDDPTFCFFCDDRTIKGMQAAGEDLDALLDTYIRATNLCTVDRPADLNIGIHMCRGNFRGGLHFSEGGYERIAEKLFQQLDVDTFYLEYDTERSGDFFPLRYVPTSKMVVLGIVTTKSPKLEDPDVLKARIHEAAEIIAQGVPARSKEEALNQLCISPQCGFASVWQGNPVTEEDMKAKIRLLQQVAKEVWIG